MLFKLDVLERTFLYSSICPVVGSSSVVCIMSEMYHLYTVSSVESISDYYGFYLLLIQHNMHPV